MQAPRTALLALALLALAAPPSWSAERAERPAFEDMRYEEDWSVLRTGVDPSDPLDPIRYIPFDEDGEFWLGFGGQLRGRYEVHRDFIAAPQTLVASPQANDDFFLFRARFHANLQLTRYFRVFAEFKSSLATDRDLPGGKNPFEDDAELQNGFVEFRLPGEHVDAFATAGRREMIYGRGRLVATADWSNLRRTFDGATLNVAGDRFAVTGFWSMPVPVDPGRFNDPDEDTQFYGLYSTISLLDDLDVDLYWLGLSSPDRFFPVTGIRAGTRHTIGARFVGTLPFTPIRFDIEGAGQFGEREATAGVPRNQDIRAGMFSALFTLPLDLPLSPALFTGYDWASGDDDPTDGKIETFDQLFPFGHRHLGLFDLTARQNIHIVHGGFQFSPLSNVTLMMNWLGLWVAERADAFYNVGGGAYRRNPGASSDKVGVEVDLTLQWQILRGLDLLLGYSHLFPGAFLDTTAGQQDDADFFYAQLQFTF